MGETRAPGACVQERRADAFPIKSIETAVAAFIGRTAAGPNEPVLVSSFAEFTAIFGPAVNGCYLGDAVCGYFLNGGAHAYVVRIGASTAPKEPLTVQDYVGQPHVRSGLSGLESIDNVTIVCAPDVWAGFDGGVVDASAARDVQLAMIAHCERKGDRLAILDAPPGLTAQQAHDWRVITTGYDSKCAVLYFPWLPLDATASSGRLIPPSGHVAGVWARSDAGRGVHKAPSNEVVRGVVGVGCSITRAEHDVLDEVGVNSVRAFLGRGVRVWGASTLSSDPRWREISVRRLVNHVESALLEGTGWLAAAPNDELTRDRLTRSVREFLFHVWLAGGLVGESVPEAFYVRCHSRTDDTDVFSCEVGLAITAPGKFIVFRLNRRGEATTICE